jgi:pimeloyl-ACP methyl ester carboxylesterase
VGVGNRVLGAAAAGMGAVATAALAGVVVERRLVKARRSAAPAVAELTSLRGEPVEVVAEDGVRLHVEVDEQAPYAAGAPGGGAPTLVFVHGYALNLDCFCFQREHFRGHHRMVFYDQRSHGRSGRSAKENATVDQLGRDLKTVLDQVVPDGPVVLVGHSMGGMAVIAFAEQHPELFGDRVVGAALLSTLAGGLRPHRILGPRLPDRLASAVTPRVIAALAKAPELVDSARRAGSNVGFLVTDRFAFGDEVPASYVEFVDEMLAGTPMDVIAEFFPTLNTLDKVHALAAFARVPTLVLCGTSDRLTGIGHSRKMAGLIDGSRLVEVRGAGHLVILERQEQVNEALAELIADATNRTLAS